MKTLRIALVCVALAACSQAPVSTLATPAARSEWDAALMQASADAAAGRYGVADRVLSDYATRHPASADAAEVPYWRAVYRLDPANQAANPREAVAMLDSYLASPGAPRRAEAHALRRIAAGMEKAGSAPPAGTAAVPKTDTAAEKVKDDEISRLKDELSKAHAELERIKRRLAQPKP